MGCSLHICSPGASFTKAPGPYLGLKLEGLGGVTVRVLTSTSGSNLSRVLHVGKLVGTCQCPLVYSAES